MNRILDQIWNYIKLLFISTDRKTQVMESPLPIQFPKEEKKLNTVIEGIKKELSSEIQNSRTSMEMNKKERLRRFIDLVTDQVLSQGYKDNENWELNLIHPTDAKYILTSGVGLASEFTESKVKDLNKTQGYAAAERYVYEALSAQWRKEYAYFIFYEGKQFLNSRNYPQFRADLHELWRQTVWADRKYSDEWLEYHKISDDELTEFLLYLATDDIDGLQKTDKPING